MNGKQMMRAWLGAVLVLLGCQGTKDADSGEGGPGEILDSWPQRVGDADRGLKVLAHEGYVGCGIPTRLTEMAGGVGALFDGEPLPGRDGVLPYYLTEFESKSGVDIISPNCFACHAGAIEGELVLGLGSTQLDFGGLAGQVGQMASLLPALQNALSAQEFAETKKFVERLATVAPYVQPTTAWSNPADNLAAILFAHRDPETLAWSEEPLMEPPPKSVIPVDVPPLWWMKKKNAMFYVGGGRGDHARIMMTASTLCVDTVEEAREIDAMFPDVRSWILSLEPPVFPEAVDEALVQEGQTVFEAECSVCHGTYDDIVGHTYPNRLLTLDEVGTDPALAVGASQFVDRFIDWFNGSFYGEISHLEPVEGYVAPPLDGLWATAPFLHNGSVPTLEGVLNSSIRPKFWKRSSVDGRAMNLSSVGWFYEPLDTGHADLNESERREVYDTTLPGHGNQGHLFGDSLSARERDAVVEYLKTL